MRRRQCRVAAAGVIRVTGLPPDTPLDPPGRCKSYHRMRSGDVIPGGFVDDCDSGDLTAKHGTIQSVRSDAGALLARVIYEARGNLTTSPGKDCFRAPGRLW